MRAPLALALLVVALIVGSCAPETAAAPRKIYAVFVGVDNYRFSRTHVREADFSDLKGAVGDTLRFRIAMGELYAVAMGEPDAQGCDLGTEGSATLLNQCATRARILAVLDAQIAARKPGDTLLFYFAGHGSRYRDDETFGQDTGYNGTILPYDARNTDGSPGDIFDIELKQRKDRATAAGIYFVSIFDSCNSATATRDGAAGQSRSVPEYKGTVPGLATQSAGPRADGGYWVHLAAAQDGEEAQETASGAVGERAGVFTTALIDTLKMPGMRDATFGDIIREVQLRVAQRGHVAQNPSAEGTLNASFGSRNRSAILFDAKASGAGAVLTAGSLSGVTTGSTFALYPDQATAIRRSGQLAIGTVASVTSGGAALSVPPGARLPAHMVAEEVAHFFPAGRLTVSNDFPPGTGHEAIDRALRGIAFVRAGSGGAAHLLPNAPGGASVILRADDGTVLADDLGRPDGDKFAAQLRLRLQEIARVQQLMALRTAVRSDGPQTATGPLSLCIDADGYRVTGCPPLPPGGVRKIDFSRRITATVINRSNRPLFVNVLAIDPHNVVNLILPSEGEFDQPQKVGTSFARSRTRMSFTVPGTYRFVAIATDEPIRADAFEQGGNGKRDLACLSPLARLLCQANEGSRDPGVTAVGNWSAQVETAIVTEGDLQR